MRETSSNVAPAPATGVKCMFLTPEERYEVYVVKASERPHLLETYKESSRSKNDPDGDDETLPPPLTDGCDIPGWRAEGMANIDSQLQAALNVGLGCTLLRRESQIPLLPPVEMNRKLQQSAPSRSKQQGLASR